MAWQRLRALFARVFTRFQPGDPEGCSANPHGQNHAMTTMITVVGLLLDEQDRQLLASVSSQSQWHVFFANNCEDACRTLEQCNVQVILCDRDVPGKEWREVVRALASTSQHASVILISRVVDRYLWNEVTRLGGYDVLPKPLRENDLFRTVRLAWSYWNGASSGVRSCNTRPGLQF